MANRHPDLVDLAKPEGSADPFVVACAPDERDRLASTLWARPVFVVIEEKRRAPAKVQIPDACDVYGMEVLRLQGLMDLEGWTDL